jgi:AcrR family transcriptional regulator
MPRVKTTATEDPAPAAEGSMCERILGAAFRLFTENGYAGASTLEIASRAKVSKRALYENFGSKQAILVACIASRADRMRLSPDLPRPRTREMLASTLTTFGGIVLREVCHPQVVAVFRLAIAEAEHAPEVARTLHASRSSNRDALADLLAEAQQTGILGPGSPQQMTEQYFALLWGDLMLGRLMGIAGVPKPAEIDGRARAATQALLKLYANPPPQPGKC